MNVSSGSVSTGTCWKFNPPTGDDTTMIGGVSTFILTRHQCITGMKEYESKSLEELRLEDYLLKKVVTGVNLMMNSTDATSQKEVLASNPFTSLESSTKSTTPMSSFSFGIPTTTVSEFSNPITFAFSNPAASTTATTVTFSNPTATPFAFPSSTDATSQKGILASNPSTSSKSSTQSTTSMSSFSFGIPTTTASEFSNPFAFSNPATSTTAISNTTATTVTFSNPTTTLFAFPSSTTATTSGFSFPNFTPFVFSSPTTTTNNAAPSFSILPNPTSTFPTLLPTDASSRPARYVRPSNVKMQLKSPEFNFSPTVQKKNLPTDASTQTEEDFRVSKLLRGLKEILLSSKHSDFVLNVKGREFRVHKIILEAHSPVFAAMMEHDTKEKATGVANIDDFEPLTITNFLDFLYTGKVENLNSDNVIDLYEVGDKYQVSELNDLCIEYMINNISVENFCDILTLSLRHHIRNLTEVATEFFLRNSKEIAITVKWGTFLAQNPVAGNELFLKALNLENK